MEKRICDIFTKDDCVNLQKFENEFDTLGFINDGKIVSIDYKPSDKTLMLNLNTPHLVSFGFLKQFEKLLKTRVGANKVKCQVTFDDCDFLKYMNDIFMMIYYRFPSTQGAFEGCTINFDEPNLSIQLKQNGVNLLLMKKIDKLIEKALLSLFNIEVKVSFLKGNEINDRYKKERDAIIEMERQKALNAEIEKQKENSNDDKDEDILYGKRITSEVMPLEEVDLTSGKVCVEGEIFKIDDERTLSKSYILYPFVIKNKKNAILCKIFYDSSKSKEIPIIKKGTYVKIYGNTEYDKYSHETIINVKSMNKCKKFKRMDLAKVKRVELHAHTKMSDLDAICDVGELVNLAADWGHKAIGITDHGALQAYPDAFYAAKSRDIKILYGIEGYLVDDQTFIVNRPDNRSLDSSYIVVDIETTGLSKTSDRITEIGAAKIRKGQIVETFQSFVNPCVPIPPKITELTGITDAMVRNAPKIEEVIVNFMKFARDDCLVAHNADFDMSFLSREAKKIGKRFTQPVIDTLALSRSIFPELKNHKLKTVLSKVKVKIENHHRAIDDAKATAYMLIKILDKIHYEKLAKTVNDLNSLVDTKNNYKNAKPYHVIIYIKNLVGRKNLYKLVSKSHLDYFYRKPRIPRSVLNQHREGLIIGSACEASDLFRAVVENKPHNELIEIADYYDYLEIQPIGNNLYMYKNGLVKSVKELEDFNRKIVELADELNKPCVATGDVHFIEKEDEIYREILMTGHGFKDASDQPPLYFRTTDDMLKEFKYLGEEKAYEVVVENTNKVADMIEKLDPIPKGTFPPSMDGAEEEIREKTYSKAHEIYGDSLPEIVEVRIKKELDSIIKHGFSVMYMIAQKLVRKSNDDGYLVGSRGSVGSSLVAYLIGITEVNSLPSHYVCNSCRYSEFINDEKYECGFDLPDKKCPICNTMLKKDGYDIPFETFLGFDGDKEPDIDLNFSGEYQSKAHKYTEELFGEGYVFRAGTISTLAEKTAIGYVLKYVEENELNLSQCEREGLAKGFEGVKRSTGQHPGGIMVVPREKEIFDFTAIQRPANDTESEIVTTHFDYHFLHSSILKLDILGHDDPTMIRMLEKISGIDATTIEIGEKTTMGIFNSTKPLGIEPKDIGTVVGSLGIPEFGTSFVRKMLVETEPTTFSELIRISGLSHGTDVWTNNAQELIKAGTCELNQAICCRDDIMLYLLHRGVDKKNAFKIMEDVRKGKGLKPEYKEEMINCNVPKWYIESCEKIKYMFPKAHAAAYVMMGFRIAWYKVHQPLAYYATYFSIRGGDFNAKIMIHGSEIAKNAINEINKVEKKTQKDANTITLLELVIEMYARGFEFLPIDLYISDDKNFIVEDNKLRPPLRTIAGLGENAARKIVEERGKSKFLSIEDLCNRAKISKAIIESMHEEYCLEGMDESNQLTLF